MPQKGPQLAAGGRSKEEEEEDDEECGAKGKGQRVLRLLLTAVRALAWFKCDTIPGSWVGASLPPRLLRLVASGRVWASTCRLLGSSTALVDSRQTW